MGTARGRARHKIEMGTMVAAPTMRKTFKYKLQPTAQQEGAMAKCVLRRCRELYSAGLQVRRDAWQKCAESITAASQSAQLPAIKEVRPEYRNVHSQVLQDVLARQDRAPQALTWADGPSVA